MELKLSLHPRKHRVLQAFNRTSMELKPPDITLSCSFIFPFNRTSMELKLEIRICYPLYNQAFNRTSMELKLLLHLRAMLLLLLF